MPATAGCSPNTRPSGGSSCRSGDPEAGHQRLPRRRGQEFLQPSRRRPGLDAARRDHRCRPLAQPTAGRSAPRRSPSRSPRTCCCRTRSRSSARSRRSCWRPASRRRCRKDRILELYLNEIYLGAGAYGVAAAALTYFNKSLDELTLGEAAFLAGLPKAPNNYNPARYPAGGEGAPRLGARPHGRGRLQRPQDAGAAAEAEPLDAAPPRGGRDRQRRPISPRRSGASCSPAMAKRRSTRPGCRCAPASMRGCRRPPTRRCATG